MNKRKYVYLLRSLLSLGIMLLCAAAAQAATVGSPGAPVVPVNDPDGAYTVTWAASATAAAVYAVEEATNLAFTANVRKVYTGQLLTVDIIKRQSGMKFFYRVKATKVGMVPSAFVKGANPCEIDLKQSRRIIAPKDNSEGTYTVSWTASSSVGASYTLQQSTAADFTGAVAVHKGTGLSYTATSKLIGSKLYFRVATTKAGFTASAWTVVNHGVLILPPCAKPASITVPATDADGNFTVTWGASRTKGVYYVLEEATDEAFTSNLRVAYSGVNLGAEISRPAEITYFYRVKAKKIGMAASALKIGTNGCAVGTVAGRPVTISIVSITKPALVPVVNFDVKLDDTGAPVLGLAASNLRIFGLALIPGANGDMDNWKQWAYERVSTSINNNTGLVYPIGTLADNGNGNYTYIFSTAMPDAAPELTAINRVRINLSAATVAGVKFLAAGGIRDFKIAALNVALAETKQTVTTNACRDCHNGRTRGHNANMNDNAAVCITCHNPSFQWQRIGLGNPAATEDRTMGQSKFDFVTMIHQIHSAIDDPAADMSWAEITYPQDMLNCTKCHNGAAADLWKTNPTKEACGSCHYTVDFVNGVNHVVAANGGCKFCHIPEQITGYHTTINKTPNNPLTPEGASEITYEIYGVTVNGSNQPVVDFAIKRDGVRMDLSAQPADLTGSPSFLVVYALPQDGIATPADYNNIGRAAAQPASVNVSALYATLVEHQTINNRYTATLTTAPFPVGATLRAVALQGYFTQVLPAGKVARHARGPVVAVTGDAVRRTVVDQDKCLKCHEIIEGHGGNRVNNPQLCVVCHNPNLSSSGRTVATLAGADAVTLSFGTQPPTDENTRTWPEASNNLKDMIHGIHGGAKRGATAPFQFVRPRSGTSYGFDWSEVTYPALLNKCDVCHLPGTCDLPLPADVLASNTQTALDGATAAEVTTARSGVNLPGADNKVSSPTAAACASCHASTVVSAVLGVSPTDHMKGMTGTVNSLRSAGIGSDAACINCHGPNTIKDVKLVHKN